MPRRSLAFQFIRKPSALPFRTTSLLLKFIYERFRYEGIKAVFLIFQPGGICRDPLGLGLSNALKVSLFISTTNQFLHLHQRQWLRTISTLFAEHYNRLLPSL